MYNPATMLHPLLRILTEAAKQGHDVVTVPLAKYYRRSYSLFYDARDIKVLESNNSLVRLETKSGPILATPGTLTQGAFAARWALTKGGQPGYPVGEPPAGCSASQGLLWQAVGSKGRALVTGGPGTGKSWALARIIERLIKENVMVEVAAPTAKAASELSRRLNGVNVRTVHNLLGWIPGQKPSMNHFRPIEADFVVIDEMSMADTEMFYNIINALPPKCGLILCGDSGQILPIGTGSPFSDLLNTEGLHDIPVVRLVEIHRQAKGSGIIEFCSLIRQGKFPTSKLPNVHIYELNDDTVVQDKAVNWYCSDFLDRKYGRKSLSESIILTPLRQKKFDVSTETLNSRISRQLFPRHNNRKFVTGDRIMFTMNSYADGFVNGQLGTLVSGEHDDVLSIRDDDGYTYNLDWSEDDAKATMEWAYALTVHKAQGSEADFVCMLLTQQGQNMYTRNLINTAASRARRELFVIGDVEQLKRAIKVVEQRESIMEYMIKNPELVPRFAPDVLANLDKVWEALS